MKIKVIWLTPGVIQLNSMNCKRSKGDEDLLEVRTADALSASGIVKIVAGEVLKVEEAIL